MKMAMVLGSVLALTAPAFADSSDDTLRFFLSKSDFVVLGEITSEPLGLVTEAGVVNYICDFRVDEILKGEKPSQESIRVNIVRFGGDEDRPPQLKKNGKCILFLKKRTAGEIPTWRTADFWSGVQHPSPQMARSLKRLVEQEQTP